jgi:long-chain fatty acid transport protein
MKRRGIWLASALLLATSAAHATSVIEFPDNGSEQQGRGGAWVARASDPLAAFYNPAGLAGQDTRLTLQANIIFQHTCFTRVKAANDTTIDGFDPGASYPRVCNDIAPAFNPQIAFTYKVSPRVGLGIAILGPSGSGNASWPEFISYNGSDSVPAPQRLLLIKSSSLILNPTLAIGGEILDGLRIGAGFVWGIARFKLSNAAPAVNGDGLQPSQNDVRTILQVQDLFFPGFTLGGIYSASEELDLGAWYKWSAPINAKGDAVLDANYFTRDVQTGDHSKVKSTDTSYQDCGYSDPNNSCGAGNNAQVKAQLPMEAKIGLRYHKPRGGRQIIKTHRRDPLSQDQFDAEVDLTWANNSSLDSFQVRFPGDATGEGVIPINGTGNGKLPPNADVPKKFRDVIGVRAGGDYNLVPDKLAARAGVFYETTGQDPTYQNIDFMGAARFGVAAGGTFRIRLGKEENADDEDAPPSRASAIEISLGYGHVFVANQVNDNPNAQGLLANAGTSCNPTVGTGQPCTSGNPRFRTNWPVNLGTITNAVNVINVGASYRF